MELDIKTRKLRIDGMTCVNCQNRIERKLQSTAGVEKVEVSYNSGTAVVTYNAETITIQEITSIIESLDYQVRSAGAPQRVLSSRNVGILVIILALFMLVQQFGLSSLANAFPLAEAGMGYGMLFLIGLVTSVHCVAMCGGINLSQCIPRAAGKADLRPSLLYNLGRVISYTVVGVIVGALGSVISFSGWMKGLVQLAAGVFMVIMGINMLGIFPGLRKFIPRMPRIFARKIEQEKQGGNSPLYIGLLNGFMPCGPLQAMQLYALSTGDPIKGGVSMLLFSLGTVPLLFGLGALSSVLSAKFPRTIMTAGAVLVAVMGLSMFSNGWSLSGFGSPFDAVRSRFGGASGSGSIAGLGAGDNLQMVTTTLAGGRYQPITVQAGIPVRWTIEAPQGSINGCNNRMIIPEYNIEHTFTAGSNVIEFTPTKAGTFRYSCWMGMIRSSITVVEPGAVVAAVEEEEFGYDDWENLTEPVPSGFRVPTNELALAEIGADQIQRVRVNLSDRGFSPASVVIQDGLPTEWIINNESTREENFVLLFPAYGQALPFDSGENILRLYPQGDFDFSTSDSEFYGYLKVVEDLEAMDIDAIKAEIGNYETLVWPPDYFGGGGHPGWAGDRVDHQQRIQPGGKLRPPLPHLRAGPSL
jgi:sulfite exporter TauE/SafE/copper chaperone CopZ